MAQDFKKIHEGLNIVPKTTSTVDSQGDIDITSADGKAHYHNGTTSSPVVTEAHSATLTNKTIDGGSNTITNIPGSAITGSLDASQIADGSVSNAEYQRLDGVTSNIQTQLNNKQSTTLTNGKVLIGNASNVATEQTVTGDITIDNAGTSAIASGVIVDADINATAAIDATKIANGQVDNTEFQYLDGVTSAIQTQLNAKASSASLTAHTGASSGVHGVTGSVVGTSDSQVLTNKTIDGDDNTVQDLPLTSIKTIVGDANKFLARNGSGVPVSTNTVPTGTVLGTTDSQVVTNKDIDGGTASNTSRITLPKASKSTLDGLTRKQATIVFASDQNKAYVDNGSALIPVGTGSGGINFMNLDSTWNSINSDNVDAENSVGSWVTFADAASSTPVDLDGGSATNLTLSRTTTAGEILDGSASFKIVKTANNSQGQGASCTFNVPPAYQGKLCTIKIPYKVTGTIATGDVTVWIYDVTNSLLMTPLANNIDQASGTLNAFFTTSPSAGTPANQQYRIGIYFGSTSANAQSIYFDDVSVGPVDSVYGPNINGWQNYTPTFTGFGTVSTQNFRWRQVGDSIEIEGRFVSGTPTATEARISLPNNYISSSTYTTLEVAGYAARNINGAENIRPLIEPSVSYLTIGNGGGATVELSKANGSSIIGSGNVLSLSAKIKIDTLSASTPVTIINPNIGPWQTYTPTFTGFGTVSTQSFRWRQVGESIEIQGRFTSGTVTATEARISLPNNYVSSSSYSSLEVVGYAGSTNNDQQIGVLIEPSVSYFTFGRSNSGGVNILTKANGNNTISNGDSLSFRVMVQVQGLSAAGVINNPRSEVFLDTGNGSGSSSTGVRRFSNTRKNTGSAITYSDSSTLGATFTINESGVYSITYQDYASGTDILIGITVNSSNLTGAVNTISYANGRRIWSYVRNGESQPVSWTGILERGDIVRAQHQSANSTDVGANFSIVKVSN